MGMSVAEEAVDDLERRIAVVCGHLNVCHGQLLDLVVETLATNGWHGWGFRSPQHWICLRTGLSPARARDLVHLAGRAAELPVTFEAVRSGRLSIDQAVVIGWHVPAHNDAEACELAVHLSVSQLRASLGRYVFDPPYPPVETKAPPADEPGARPAGPAEPAADATADVDAEPAAADPAADPDADSAAAGAGADAPGAGDPRLVGGDVWFWFDERGRFRLGIDAPVDDGLIIEQALREARDALIRAGRTDVSWLDAFNEICRRSLASNSVTGVGASRADRYRLYLHLDTEGAWVDGHRVPQALVDQILCDGVVRPVWTTGGTPVNVGRATKTISTELRRLVLHRDGHRCRTPGCDNTLGLEVHHVLWFDRDSGPTATWNLATECGGCHHHIHRGHINIAGDADDPDGLVFTDDRGRPLIRYPVPIPPTGPPPEPSTPYQHPLGEHMHTRWLWFKPPPAA